MHPAYRRAVFFQAAAAAAGASAPLIAGRNTQAGEEERAIEAAWVETEALVLGVFRKAKRAMNYRNVVEEMAGNVPQILIRSLQDVAPHTRLGAVVRKTLLRLQTAGKVTTDTLDSSRWRAST